MLAHERQAELQRLIEEHGTVVVSELARHWEISEMTVRRDLKLLEERGIVSRVHGGAVASGALRWRARLDQDRGVKEQAVAKLTAFLPEFGCIYLDGSTTIFHLIDAMDRASGLTVATNNVDTLQRLAACPGVRPVLIGGRLNEATDNLVGPVARRSLEALAFDAAFFSAYAIDVELGCSEPELEDAEVKNWVIERSAAQYLAINHQKLGQRAAGVWVSDPTTTTLATDLAPDDPQVAAFAARAARIL